MLFTTVLFSQIRGGYQNSLSPMQNRFPELSINFSRPIKFYKKSTALSRSVHILILLIRIGQTRMGIRDRELPLGLE